MKKLKSTMSGLLLTGLLYSTPAGAIDLYGMASYWDHSDLDGVWGGALGVSLSLFTDFLRLDARVYFFDNSYIFAEDVFEEDEFTRLESDLSITPFDLGLQLHILPGAQVDPYLLAGFSYLYVDSDWFDFDSSLGGYGGGGLDIALGNSPLHLFGEIVYRFAELEGRLGSELDVSGLNGNLGMKLHF